MRVAVKFRAARKVLAANLQLSSHKTPVDSRDLGTLLKQRVFPFSIDGDIPQVVAAQRSCSYFVTVRTKCCFL